MALSHSNVRGLLGAVNDNLGLLPSELRRTPARVVPLRRPSLEIEMPNLYTEIDASNGILWARMKHPQRACYTPELMQDMRHIQLYLREQLSGLSPAQMPFRWLVWASEAPEAWSLGGDFTTCTAFIQAGDYAGLRRYARQAIEILYDNYTCMDLPILTVALIQGDAVGGGFEAMLTDDIVIAEQGAKFGLPEILFNLFPGMGGYSFLRRKVTMAMTRTFIEDGLSRSAQEMQKLGLVDAVCAPGEGERELHRYVAENGTSFAALRTMQHDRRCVDPVTLPELVDIVDKWTDLAMKLGVDDLRRMDCLARVQEKKKSIGNLQRPIRSVSSA